MASALPWHNARSLAEGGLKSARRLKPAPRRRCRFSRKDALRRSERRLNCFAGDVELAHHGVEGGARHAQSGGGRVTTPSLSRSTRRICSRSTCSRVPPPAVSAASTRISSKGARRLVPWDRITARSMKFSSSRTLPGHEKPTGRAWSPPGSCRSAGPSCRHTCE